MSEDNQSSPALTTPIRPLPILGGALALGLLFDFLLFGKVPGIGIGLYVLAIVVGTLALSRRFRKPLSRVACWFAALAVLFALLVGVRASYELAFMNIVLSVVLLMLVVSEMVGQEIRQFSIEKYVTLGWLPWYFLGNIGLYFKGWFQQRQGERTGKTSAWLRGIFLALPVLILFTVLFSSADLVFQKYTQAIIDLHISPETLVRMLLVLVVTLLFLGAFWFIFTHTRKQSDSTDAAVKTSSIGRLETRILLGSVNVLFLLFILVQLTYLFGGQKNITGQGFTFAEYARRGFFELIIVAIVSWLVVWTLSRTLAASDAKVQKTAKVLNLALVLQVFVIMASAFMRLVLYEQAYGFTTQRFYSHVAIVWLAVAFVLLLYKLFVSRREERLAFSMLISVVAFVAALNLFNPDAFIVRQNVTRYATTGNVDVFYLDQLSPDAVPAMLPMLETKDLEVANLTANRLYWKLQQLDQTPTKWQSFNIGRQQAQKLLKSKFQILENNKDFDPTHDFMKSQSTPL